MQIRKTAHTARSKNALSSALLELMLEKDYNDITINELSEKAGVARQTFYSNYTNKNQLLDYCIDQLATEFQQQYITEHSTGREVIRDVFVYCEKIYPQIKALSSSGFEVRMLNRIIVQNAELRSYFGHNSRNLYFDSFCAGAVFSVVLTWIKNGMKPSPSEMADVVVTALGPNNLGKIF